MQADNGDTTDPGGAAANIDSENIGNDRSSNGDRERTEGPVHMVLVSPFDEIADGEAELHDVLSLLAVLELGLEGLEDRVLTDKWLNDRIYDCRRTVRLAVERLRPALEKIVGAETVLHAARVPRQFRRMA